MVRRREQGYGQQRVTLRQTLVVAILLHLMLAGVASWRPDLLWSQPVIPPAEEQQPLEFRFVDLPDTPEQPSDTEILSDRDRVARDESERDDADEPFSEGNTPQEVLRSELPPTEVVAEPTPPEVTESVPTPAEAISEAAEERPGESRESESAEPLEGEEPTRETVEPGAATGPPATLPPRQPRLRSSMANLSAFVDDEILHRPDGGTDGERGLVSFDTKGYDLGEYLAEVLKIIERNWRSNIPDAARLPGMEGATFVRMSIERVGQGSGRESARIVIHRTWSSGKKSFDQAAVFALEVSSPLPPIPDFFPYETLDGRLGFLYNLDPDEVTFPSGG